MRFCGTGAGSVSSSAKACCWTRAHASSQNGADLHVLEAYRESTCFAHSIARASPDKSATATSVRSVTPNKSLAPTNGAAMYVGLPGSFNV
eukprot:COSAG02_NODE_21771_length_775_cov_1.439349_1_plen_91_part_00